MLFWKGSSLCSGACYSHINKRNYDETVHSGKIFIISQQKESFNNGGVTFRKSIFKWMKINYKRDNKPLWGEVFKTAIKIPVPPQSMVQFNYDFC
ncbi:MAG: hypothetical protein R2769_07860 [Saprospiraceae bacterium]